MTLIYAFLIGASGALLGAVLGVGGGIVMVPAFLKLGLSMKHAISTSLAVIAVTAVTSTALNARSGQIDWRIAAAAALAAVAAAYFGTGLKNQMPAAQLKLGFGLLLIATGIYMVATRSSV